FGRLEDLRPAGAVFPEDVTRVFGDVSPEGELPGAVGHMLRCVVLSMQEAVTVAAGALIAVVGVAAFEDFDQCAGQGRVGRYTVADPSQKFILKFAPLGLGPSLHRLPGPGGSVAGVQNHHQAAKPRRVSDSILNELRE